MTPRSTGEVYISRRCIWGTDGSRGDPCHEYQDDTMFTDYKPGEKVPRPKPKGGTKKKTVKKMPTAGDRQKAAGMTGKIKPMVPAQKKPAAKVPAKKKSATREPTATTHTPTKKVTITTDVRHQPWVDTDSVIQHFHIYHAGNPDVAMTARINDNAMIASVKAVAKIVKAKLTAPEKRKKYNKEIRALAGPACRFPKGTWMTQESHKEFTTIIKLVAADIPYKDPNQHLDDFIHKD